MNVAIVLCCAGDVGEYQVPYQNCVPNDPSIEDMKKVVVTQEIRPGIDERWNSHEVITYRDLEEEGGGHMDFPPLRLISPS